jgi:preprotein translocase subunit SecB
MTKKKKAKVVKRKADRNAGLLVSDRVQLKDIRLIHCKCDQTPDVALGKKNYDINYSTEVEIDKKSGYIIVIPKFHFEAFVENKVSGPVLLIDASFLLAYKVENFEGLTQSGFEQFANLNGIYNAWPYWREFVQNTIVRMGLPSLSIPVFRIVESQKEKKQKAKKKKVTNKKGVTL